MKTRLALAVAALQVIVLAFMIGQREWIARTGTPITLRTAPLDPNDPMRGAYVRFNYEISTVPVALCRGEVVKWTKITGYPEQRGLRDRVVFAALKVNEHGIADLISLSDTSPVSGLFLRGRVESVSVGSVSVRYGIEALFMSKDAAQKMEDLARHAKAGAPVDVHLAVGLSGISVLKDYAWEPLGLTVAFDRTQQPAANDPTQRRQPQTVAGLTITLHNYGDRDLAVVNLPDAKSFRLVPSNQFGTGHYTWVGENQQSRPAPRAADIVVLKPGATHSLHLDLTQPQWWVIDTSKPGSLPLPLQKIQDGWSASFRIEYAPPSAEACRGLPHADLISHAPLHSRAFNANQGLD